jgi:hypothetical protein
MDLHQSFRPVCILLSIDDIHNYFDIRDSAHTGSWLPVASQKDLNHIAKSQKRVLHDAEAGFRNIQVKLYSPSKIVISPRLSNPVF